MIQPAFLVKRSSNLELSHRNTWKILTRKAASFENSQPTLLFRIFLFSMIHENYFLIPNTLSKYYLFYPIIKIVYALTAFNVTCILFFQKELRICFTYNRLYKNYVSVFCVGIVILCIT